MVHVSLINTVVMLKKLKVLINRMKSRFANAESKIMASQQTISGQTKHLSRQTFGLSIILTGHIKKWLEKKNTFTPLCFKRTSIFFLFMFLLAGLVCSSYYPVIFKILSGQKRDETTLKFLWPVNMTSNSPKFILNPSMYSLLHTDVVRGWTHVGQEHVTSPPRTSAWEAIQCNHQLRK